MLPVHLPWRAGLRRHQDHQTMKLACVRQIADLAKADISEEVANAYAGQGADLWPRLPDPHTV